MKPLDTPTKTTAANAWGRDCTTMRQTFEVEPQDVGIKWPHYLGFNHKDYIFFASDVGRQIVQQRDGTGWTCWSFKT